MRYRFFALRGIDLKRTFYGSHGTPWEQHSRCSASLKRRAFCRNNGVAFMMTNSANIILNSQEILFVYGLQGELPGEYPPTASLSENTSTTQKTEPPKWSPKSPATAISPTFQEPSQVTQSCHKIIHTLLVKNL